ncbi:MAG TPA: hypothetical protein PKD83_08565 [Ignavibacteria bacterium]|nr:hypothetical protein [Ignavibacteria bacterium]
MKKLLVLLLFILLFPVQSFPEDDPTLCTMDLTENSTDPIPNYIQPWWNNVRIGKFAVVYVDFPDGRYINGSDTLQPFYDNQLE